MSCKNGELKLVNVGDEDGSSMNCTLRSSVRLKVSCELGQSLVCNNEEVRPYYPLPSNKGSEHLHSFVAGTIQELVKSCLSKNNGCYEMIHAGGARYVYFALR